MKIKIAILLLLIGLLILNIIQFNVNNNKEKMIKFLKNKNTANININPRIFLDFSNYKIAAKKKKIVKKPFRKPRFVLQGIFSNHNKKFVIINNKTLTKNEWIYNYKIRKIFDNQVMLYNSKQNDLVTLKLKDKF